MKFKKSGYYCEERSLNQSSNSSNNESNRYSRSAVDERNDFFYEKRYFTCERVDESDDNVEKEEHKKFTIGKAYTVSNPGAMMIHV
jgi:hypothetical protein